MWLSTDYWKDFLSLGECRVGKVGWLQSTRDGKFSFWAIFGSVGCRCFNQLGENEKIPAATDGNRALSFRCFDQQRVCERFSRSK